MSATFSRTLRSLGSDRSRFWIVDLIVGGIVVAWAAWFLLADVAVYEVSEKARLEVESAAHAIAAPVAGKIIQTQLTIGRTVRAGEVLLVLDSEAEHLAVTEKRTRRRTMDARL